MRRYRRKQLESSIENSCREYAHARGWSSRKMNGLGFRSWPDRFFIPPPLTAKQLRMGAGKRSCYLEAHQVQKKKRFWIEFKRDGEESTPDQARMQRDLRSRGEYVYECDSKEKFIRIFNEHNAG